MLKSYHFHIASYLFLITHALPAPDHEEAPPSPDVDANVDFSLYPDFQSLRPCLQELFFGGPANQVAINVQCVANSCLCTPENIEENLLHISTQVEEKCAKATNVDERIAQATSVLGGYCSMVTAGLTTTTLGGGSPKPTSTSKQKPKDDTPTDDEPYPLPDDSKDDEEPSKGGIRIGSLSLGAFLGIVIPTVFGIIATIFGACTLCHQRDAQRWRNSRP